MKLARSPTAQCGRTLGNSLPKAAWQETPPATLERSTTKASAVESKYGMASPERVGGSLRRPLPAVLSSTSDLIDIAPAQPKRWHSYQNFRIANSWKASTACAS